MINKKVKSIKFKPGFSFKAGWLFVLTFLTIIFMTIGYSSLNAELNITGEAKLKVAADIRLTNCSLASAANGGLEDYPCVYSKDNFQSGITLPNLNSTITYDITVTNFVSLVMVLNNINDINFNNTDMEYVLSNISIGSEISGISDLTFQVTFRYKSSVSVLPENTHLGSQIQFEFSEKTYILTVLADGGTWEGTTPQNIVPGDSVTIVDPTRANYSFTGWTLTGTGSSIDGTTFTMGTADATLTANWVMSTFTLTVNANSGTWSGTTPQTLSAGDSVTITNPTRTGYVFTSWTVSGTGSSMNGTTFTMGTANTTLTANWLAFASMFTYTGSKTIVDDGNGNYRIKFLTNGTFTPLVNMTIDVFLVGGGGGGSNGGPYDGGGGGGGGYTATYTSITLAANTAYPISVGTGGAAKTSGIASTAFGYSANPGVGSTGGAGKAGGSGGGSAGNTTYRGGKVGGSNGSSGTAGAFSGGAGQVGTTYEFGDSSLSLYSGGGGGGAYNTSQTYAGGAGGAGGGGYGGGTKSTIGNGSRNGSNGTANTGGGGGGGSGAYYGGAGGTGIVIIRNHQ